MGHWWVPGLVIGYEHSFVHAVADFLKGLETGVPAQPDFRSALQTQKVCEAVLRSASVGTLGADGSGRLRHDASDQNGLRIPAVATKAAELYEEDFYAWTRGQAAALRRLSQGALERTARSRGTWPRRSRTWAASAATRSGAS